MNLQSLQRLFESAKKKLKGTGVTLELQGKGNWIYIRGVFPPKPEGKFSKPHQQRIALKMRLLDADSVTRAELTARQVGLALNLGEFSWDNWSDREGSAENGNSLKELAQRFEEEFWKTRNRDNTSHHSTWQVYKETLKSLPDTDDLTLEHLLAWLDKNKRKSRSRVVHCSYVAKHLAQLAGLPTEAIGKVERPKDKPINPRDLPNDSELLAMQAQIEDEALQWMFRTMLVYGLRNHEIFFLDYEDFPDVGVPEKSKTGTRLVLPLKEEWAIEWQLDKRILPTFRKPITPDVSLKRLGAIVTTQFYNSSLEISPYTLRHCYARRCFELGIPVDIASNLMGHSSAVHINKYRYWFDKKAYIEKARKLLKEG